MKQRNQLRRRTRQRGGSKQIFVRNRYNRDKPFAMEVSNTTTPRNLLKFYVPKTFYDLDEDFKLVSRDEIENPFYLLNNKSIEGKWNLSWGEAFGTNLEKDSTHKILVIFVKKQNEIRISV